MLANALSAGDISPAGGILLGFATHSSYHIVWNFYTVIISCWQLRPNAYKISICRMLAISINARHDDKVFYITRNTPAVHDNYMYLYCCEMRCS